MNPQDVAAWFNLGVMFTGGGNGEPALRCFRRAAELEPHNAEYQFHYAWYLGDQGNLEESLLVFQHAIALNPEPRYYDRLGRILGDAGRIDDSMRAFDHAAQLDPAAPPSLNRALVLVRWGRFEEAAPLLRGITDITPDASVVQRELGWCLHHMGRFEEALSRYDLAASLSAYGKPIAPWSSSTGKKCWLYRGTTYAAMGRLTEALADLSVFAEARQDYPGIEETIEQIKIQLGER
ncbi:MAG: tetratricopeptide repeat protein [Phycisphaerales bacterium]